MPLRNLEQGGLTLTKTVVREASRRSDSSKPIYTLTTNRTVTPSRIELTVRSVGGNLEGRFTVSQIDVGNLTTFIQIEGEQYSNDKAVFQIGLFGTGDVTLFMYPVRDDQPGRSLTSLTDYRALSDVTNTVVIQVEDPTSEVNPTSPVDLMRRQDLLHGLAVNCLMPSGDRNHNEVYAGKPNPQDADAAAEKKLAEKAQLGGNEGTHAQLAGFSQTTSRIHRDSEYLTLQPRIPADAAETYTDYGLKLQQSMSFVTSAVKTRDEVFGSGNVTSQTTSVEHKAAQAMRFESNSTFDVRGPMLTLTGQSTVIEAGAYHSLTSLSQHTAVHHWRRSQESSTYLTKIRVEEVADLGKTYYGAHLSLGGLQETYYDQLVFQVGQESEPIGSGKILNDIGQTGVIIPQFGDAWFYYQQSCYHQARTGRFLARAFLDMLLESQTGRAIVKALQDIVLSTMQNIGMEAANRIDGVAGQAICMSAGNEITFSAPIVRIAGTSQGVMGSNAAMFIEGQPLFLNSGGFSVPGLCFGNDIETAFVIENEPGPRTRIKPTQFLDYPEVPGGGPQPLVTTPGRALGPSHTSPSI